jgi:hypothetical protein
MAARQNPTDAQRARQQLASRYDRDADAADAMAANAPTPSVAEGLKRVSARKRKYASTAKRMAGE